jgi:hypothetical protein
LGFRAEEAGTAERPSITRDQVFAGPDALTGEGIQTTVKLIGDRCGRSLSTMAPHVADWKAERGGRAVADSPNNQGNVAAAFRQVRAAACNAAQAAIHAEREGPAAARPAMKRERAELAEDITDRQGKLDAAQKQREKLAERGTALAAAAGGLAWERVENACLTGQATTTEKRAQELGTQVTDLQREFALLAARKEGRKPKAKPPSPPPKPRPEFLATAIPNFGAGNLSGPCCLRS